MKFDIPLLINPQILIPFNNQFNYKHSSAIEAIFIPYRNNKQNINSLLLELKWYDGIIYLIPSNENDSHDISLDKFNNVKILYMYNNDFNLFFKQLNTTKHKFIISPYTEWDLPQKRNYAIWFSIYNKFTKILFIDDDIRGISSSLLERGASNLDRYTIVGCFVENFPDTSIVGHLEISSGNEIKCFISGSFLFIKPFNTYSFFPLIYNEDWIFMVQYIINKEVCSIGTIYQVPYDPFTSQQKIIFQEFGEIIAEGLFAIINKKLFEFRYNYDLWCEILSNRQNLLFKLKKIISNSLQKQLLDTAIEQNYKIHPRDCIDYIKLLEDDIFSWRIFIKEYIS